MGLKVLIIEDEALVAEEMRTRIEYLGHRVVGTSAEGPRAIQLAEREHPDLVLVDFRLRGAMNGLQTAQEIRKQEHGRVPFIFVTASPELRITDEVHPCVVLRKPFGGSDLRRAIEGVLSERAAMEETESAHA